MPAGRPRLPNRLDAPALRRHAVSMSPRVRAVLELVSEMTEDERVELREKLGGDELDQKEWTAAWNDELANRMGQIERGEVKLLTRRGVLGRRRYDAAPASPGSPREERRRALHRMRDPGAANRFRRAVDARGVDRRRVRAHREPPAPAATQRMWGTGGFSSSDGQRWVVPVPSAPRRPCAPISATGAASRHQRGPPNQFRNTARSPAWPPCGGDLRPRRHPRQPDRAQESPRRRIRLATRTSSSLESPRGSVMPRLRHVGGTCLYRINRSAKYPNLDFLLRGAVNPAKSEAMGRDVPRRRVSQARVGQRVALHDEAATPAEERAGCRRSKNTAA